MKKIGVIFVACSLVWSLGPAGSAFARGTDDSLYDQQWYLDQISAPAAWDTTTGSHDVIVAVLDSGVDPDHPDLVDNLWVNPGEMADNGKDDDGNGFVDDVHGWDFVRDDNTPEPDAGERAFSEDGVAHGTVISGIVGAVGNNGVGVSGVAWSVRIMPVRILDNEGAGESDDARAAIRYAVQNGADVINLSFTGYDVDTEFERAVNEAYVAGIPVVAAVGNYSDTGLDLNETPVYPACFAGEKADWVIGVAATDEHDAKAGFSNYGSDCVEIAAPGTDVFNVMYENDDWAEFDRAYDGGWAGTSVSAPIVTGAIALLKSAYPSLGPSLVRTILQLSADPIRDRTVEAGALGTGRLNVARALEIAPQFVGQLEPVAADDSPSTHIVTAPAAGAPPTVRVFTNDGMTRLWEFNAYDAAFQGGVRVAMGDLDGDGADEIVTAPGPGGGPHVRAFEQDGTVIGQFFAFESTSRTGVNVSVGDVDGDGRDEILVGEDAGGTGRVRVFGLDGAAREEVQPFGSTTASVRVAGADVDGDGRDEIASSRGTGYGPEVRVVNSGGTARTSFLAYASTYDRGVYVSAGDLDGDGVDEIVTGTDAGGGPQVRVFDGEGTVLGSFFAYDSLFRGGVRVGVGQLDGRESIITAPGPGGGPQVRVFDQSGRALGQFFAGDETSRSGLNVGAWSP